LAVRSHHRVWPLLGFYRDEGAEHNTLYVIGGNTLIKGEAA